MIKVENVEVFNFEGALRGMRNPLASHAKADSTFNPLSVGTNDLSLMKRLYNAGSEHCKYLRQIAVCMDITAPLYWWKEMDQYRIGVTTDSFSTMHRLTSRYLDVNDFSHDHLNEYCLQKLESLIAVINMYRDIYLDTEDKEDWYQLIQLLPSSYNQRRTVTMSYANVMNIINQRQHHKLVEWHTFCDELRKLPYINDIRGENGR